MSSCVRWACRRQIKGLIIAANVKPELLRWDHCHSWSAHIVNHVLVLDLRRQPSQAVPVIAREAPFIELLKRRWRPAEMATPPPLPEIAEPIPLEHYYALLINPFYPKDPAASFGKHVLTPS